MKLRLIRQPNIITVTIPDNEPFNLAQYGGTGVGATNAIHVQPGTGATFPVSGTFWQTTQPISAASLPLPSGAATSALQLPDGHNVTIDNATGAAAVNVQDGGNSLTIDGSVTVTGNAGVISTNNSTTATLNAGIVFTGVADEVTNYKSIGIIIKASHASATNGLAMQFSYDGVSWDIVHSFTLPATTGKFFNLPVEARYFRIVYTNGGTNQTYFRLQTIYHATVTKESTLRLEEDIDAETAAQLGRSVITGEKPLGGFTNVQVSTNGNLKMSLEEIDTGALGQEAMAASLPVVIASDQSALPVTGTFWQTTQPVSLASLPTLATLTNLVQMNGQAISMGTGTRDAGTQRVTIATNDSVPVTGTFWQTTQPVSIASMPSTPVTGTFWQATQPVNGTVTANLSATDNSVLDDIATSLAIIDDWDSPADHCNIRHLNATDDVVVANLSATDNAVLDTIDSVLDTINAKLVTGTVIGDVNLGATDNAVLDSILTALQTIDNFISGSEGQVDVITLPATPAGTNAIGKLLPPDIDVTTNANYAKKYYTNAGAVTDGIIWSPAAGKRWHIHTITINVSAAATVTLEDDLAGGDSPIYKAEFAANSGVVLTFPEKYPWASGEDAADLIITTTAGNVYVTCSGFEI